MEENDSDHEAVYCLHCDETVSEEDHMSVCPSYPCQCPRNCSIKGLRRSELKSHKTVCPLEPVRCVYYKLGCHARLDRYMLSKHMETNLLMHNELLVSRVESSQKESDMLRDELKKLYSEMSIFVDRSLKLHEDVSTEIGIIESLIMRMIPDDRNILDSLSVMRSLLHDVPPLVPCGSRLTYRLPPLPDRTQWDGPSCILGSQWILQMSFKRSSNYLTTPIAHVMLSRLPSNNNPNWPTDNHTSIHLSTSDGYSIIFELSSDSSSSCTLPIRRVDSVFNKHDNPIIINLYNVLLPYCEDKPLVVAIVRLNIKPSQVFHLVMN